MLFTPFNSYTVYKPFGRDWTVGQLTTQVENGYTPEGFPIDGDSIAVSLGALEIRKVVDKW